MSNWILCSLFVYTRLGEGVIKVKKFAFMILRAVRIGENLVEAFLLQ